MQKHLLPLVILLGFTIFSLRSIFHPGFMYTHDSLWHIERLQNMASLITTSFPVRFSPTLDNGYGVPLFNFTYPFPYYLGAGLMLLGFGPIMSYNGIILLAYFLGGVGVYLLVSRPLLGLLGAILYLLTPYQYLDIFVRGALGEVFALGIIPWIFLSFRQLGRDGRFRFLTPLPLTLLLLSHNFYAYLVGILLVFFIIFIYDHKRLQLYSILLSLALSAFFILPALLEANLLLYTILPHTTYQDHFLSLAQLVYSKWSYLGSLPGTNVTEMSYQLGFANLIILFISIFSLAWLRSPKLKWYLLAILVATFLMLPESNLLWQVLPLLSSIQFPWRFLGIITVILPLVYYEIARLFDYSKKFYVLSFCLLVIALYSTRNYGRPVKWLSSDEFYNLHYEYVGKTTTAKREEIVPRWSVVERYQSRDILQDSQDLELQDLVVLPTSISFTVKSNSNQSKLVTLPRNYYPMWKLRVDEQPSSLSPSADGDLEFSLLPGSHKYYVYLESTLVQKLANLISFITLVSWIAFYSRSKNSPRSTK